VFCRFEAREAGMPFALFIKTRAERGFQVELLVGEPSDKGIRFYTWPA